MDSTHRLENGCGESIGISHDDTDVGSCTTLGECGTWIVTTRCHPELMSMLIGDILGFLEIVLESSTYKLLEFTIGDPSWDLWVDGTSYEWDPAVLHLTPRSEWKLGLSKEAL